MTPSMALPVARLKFYPPPQSLGYLTYTQREARGLCIPAFRRVSLYRRDLMRKGCACNKPTATILALTTPFGRSSHWRGSPHWAGRGTHRLRTRAESESRWRTLGEVSGKPVQRTFG